MRLPGFTAENSLSIVSASYEMASTHASADTDARVLPQYFYCHGNYCCNEYGYCIYKGHVLM